MEHDSTWALYPQQSPPVNAIIFGEGLIRRRKKIKYLQSTSHEAVLLRPLLSLVENAAFGKLRDLWASATLAVECSSVLY